MATRRPLVIVNGVTSELPAGDVVAVPVSGITPGSARQLLQTNAAGTASEWTSNVDVPGTLDVTGVATLDSTVGVSGAATFGSTVSVAGATTLNGAFVASSTVGVSGVAIFASGVNVSGALAVGSTATIAGATTVAGTTTFGGAVIVNTSGALTLPEGTTAERPAVPASGDIRFNVDTTQFEGYNGTAWGALGGGGGATGSGTNEVFYENDIEVTGSYTITTGKNAMTAGPVTVASGVTVTVPSGSSWTVV